jgi:hypothetical protein
MEEKYAFQAQKMAFGLGAIAFIVFLFMLKTALTDVTKLPEPNRFPAASAVVMTPQLRTKVKHFLSIIALLVMLKVCTMR